MSNARCVPRAVMVAACAAAPFLAELASAQTASFTVFQGSPASRNNKLSRVAGTGQRAVGWTDIAPTGYLQCVWTSPAGPPIAGQAYNISEDGVTICGATGAANPIAMYRATTGGPIQFVRGFSGESGDIGIAYDLTLDRSTFVGYLQDDDGINTAFRWSIGQTSAQRLGRLDNVSTFATATNATGNAVAGYANMGGLGAAAWRWTAETGIVPLGGPLAYVTDMSADGNTIVGEASVNNGRAFIWNAARGTTIFDLLPGSVTGYARAWGVSGDGSIVVGEDPGPNSGGHDEIATYWSPHTGYMRLDDLLEWKYGLTLPDGWALAAGTDVSDDGRYIAGYGRDETGREFGFVVTLPSPSAATLMSLGACVAVRRRRTVR